ncbi:UDP-glucose dehydrogenase family protein [Acidihalobacter prosperus]|uniref:UDP-glucose 6-dehydrogenase n=1 Tax=Acidihalobacter prosperus TaxID=160660 RepID=A0A1A6C7L3_9GAMM|nr:nucleotide sugar dehydrogenase [Acidihalobacter prosperus]OBS10540.1 nucleotide sugar dehydrogenase [Acidihalobacter prosperus]
MAQHAFIVGLGHVGLATAVCLAELGCRVTAHDHDAARMDGLAEGRLESDEPALVAAFLQGVAAGQIALSRRSHPDGPIDFAFACVGTPLKPDGRPATTGLRNTLIDLAARTPGDFLLVLKSVPPPGGALSRLQAALARLRTPTRNLPVVITPEFPRRGQALRDITQPSRIVIGTDDGQAANTLAKLYAPLRSPILFVSPASAQLIKYASNAFFAAKISFINEIASLARSTGADVRSVAEGMALDPRIGADFIEPGIGYGGDCLPREVRALERLIPGHRPGMLRATLAINARQREAVISTLNEALGTLRGKEICIFGLAFKAGTGDVREAPGLAVIDALRRGGAHVRAYDPRAGAAARDARPADERLSHYDDAYQAAAGADAVVIATDWPEFRSLDWTDIAEHLSGPRVVVDGRNLLEGDALRALGLSFIPLAG